MIDENKRLNIILGILCIIFIIVIIYIINYRNNLESGNVYFKVEDIKNNSYEGTDAIFNTNGKTFNLTIDNEEIFKDEKFILDVHTGKIIEGRLYLRSVTGNSIILWYNEAEYKLDKK